MTMILSFIALQFLTEKLASKEYYKSVFSNNTMKPNHHKSSNFSKI